MPRFFLEAKPFREDIYDQEETRKAITKAYNKGVPWVGITNFQRFVLYDAQEELTAALPRGVFDLSHGDYLNTPVEAGIHLLTPEAIQSRALEDYAQRIAGHLDSRVRERILRRNIFGVDLDPQAVEIARLNLLIRMVRQQELLPELKDNIRHGNSLIQGGEAELRPYFGDGWEEKHPFNWEREFPEIMADGGFDIIIGNPPYVRIQTLDRQEVDYYNKEYDSATGNYDIYCLFVERALKLLKPGGRVGVIIPNKFMQAAYGKGLRGFLSEAQAVSKVVDFGDAEVFESGTNYTCLLFLKKETNPNVFYISAAETVKECPQPPSLTEVERAGFDTSWEKLTERPWSFVSTHRGGFLDKLVGAGQTLENIADLFVGLQTSADRIYIAECRSAPDSGTLRVICRANGNTYDVERELFHPLLKGSLHIRRYHFDPTKLSVLFPYHERDGVYELTDTSTIA